MNSKKEHHLFMESLRQALPQEPSHHAVKSLRDLFSSDDEELSELFEQMLADLSEFETVKNASVSADESN